MQGIVCQEAASSGDLISDARERGLLLVGAAENTIRILPPLIIEESHVDEAVSILEEVAKSWEVSHAA